MTAICAGDENVFIVCKEILSIFCKHMHYVGYSGNAQKLKIINNLAESINLVSAAEIVNLAYNLGFDIATIAKVLTTARGKSDYMSLLLNRLLHENTSVIVTLAVRLKDLELAKSLIQEKMLKPVLFDKVFDIFKKAEQLYRNEADQSTCLEVVKNLSVNHNENK